MHGTLRLKIAVSALLAVTIAASSAFAQSLPVCPAPAQVVTSRFQTRATFNQDYCRTSQGLLKLDYVKPVGPGKFPAIIFIHGGSWRWGSKDGFGAQMQSAAAKGFVAIAINYRLTKIQTNGTVENAFPVHLNDVQCAIRFVRSNADALQIDISRLGIFGESAGAHLGLLAGLKDPASVRSVAVFYPPTDIDTLGAGSDDPTRELQLEQIFGGGIGSSEYVAASPIRHFTSAAPPILTIHGTDDSLVRFTQSEKLVAAAAQVGSPMELISCPGEVHGFTPVNRARSFEHVFNFFFQTLK